MGRVIRSLVALSGEDGARCGMTYIVWCTLWYGVCGVGHGALYSVGYRLQWPMFGLHQQALSAGQCPLYCFHSDAGHSSWATHGRIHTHAHAHVHVHVRTRAVRHIYNDRPPSKRSVRGPSMTSLPWPKTWLRGTLPALQSWAFAEKATGGCWLQWRWCRGPSSLLLSSVWYSTPCGCSSWI